VRVRSLLILATMVLGVLLLGGVTLAVTKACATNPCVGTDANDKLRGDERANQIYGLGGDDGIRGKAGTDELNGGRGNDTLDGGVADDRVDGDYGSDREVGGPGNDLILAADGYKDTVYCGLGTDDTAYVDNQDVVNKECENVWEAQAQNLSQ
jgi:Ca2+-binding RTX toxin-like protein